MDKPLTSIVDILKNADKEIAVSQSRANPEFVNVSALSKLCAREYYFTNQHKNKIRSAQYVASNTRVTFKMGRAIEEHVREQLLTQMSITKVLGMWNRVLYGKHTYEIFNKDLNIMETLELRFGEESDKLVNFREIDLWDKVNKIKGHPDWVFLDKNGKLTVVEIKSISSKNWELHFLKAPNKIHALKEHKEQVLPYVYRLGTLPFIKEKKLDINQYGQIVYVCKDWRSKHDKEKQYNYDSMYREFVTPMLDHETEVRGLLEESKLAIESIQAKTIPPRTHCLTDSCSKAKTCPYVARCFSI